jgi:hypothetical protein
MTDVMDSGNPGGGPFFIWDRELAKFVRMDQASEDQIRLYGGSQYTSFGSGRSRVMTPINPRGEATSYAVTESTRRGELVPAPRSAGRAESIRLREQRSELEGSRAARLQRNAELLNIDYNNQTDWLMMTESVRRLVVTDPSLLENQPINIDFEAVLDYAMYGTPRSPGVFMGGTSNSFIFDQALNRYVNVNFASDDQMRQYSDTMYYRTSRGQMLTIRDDKAGPEVETEMPEEPRPVRSVTDIEGFPVDAMIGETADVSIVGPWLERNAKNLDTNELNIVDRFLRDQANIDVYRVRQPGVETPWAGSIQAVKQTRENVKEQKQREERERRQQETIEREGTRLLTPEQEMQARTESDEGRRLARREEQQRQRFADIAAKLKPEARWMEMQYTAVPLGFSEQEFARVDASVGAQLRLQEANDALRDAKTNDPNEVGRLEKVVEERQRELLIRQQQEAGFTFREGVFIPYSARDRLDASLAQEYEQRALGRSAENVNAAFTNRVRNLQINELRLQPGTDFRSQDLLTEGQAMSMLRSVASTPAEMIKLKTQLAFVYGREDQYTSDTAVDSGAVNNFMELVTEANNAGMKPLEYLKMSLNDPSVVERSNERARNRGPGAGFTIRVPAVDDVATVFQDVARRRVGMQLDQEQVRQMAQTYVQQYESQLRGQMGRDVISEPMSADTFAEQQISQQFGGEETVFQTGLQLDTLIEMIGGTR